MRGSAPAARRSATVCGTAAVTRKAAGSTTVTSGRPGMAMSPNCTGTSDTTPANGARTT